MIKPFIDDWVSPDIDNVWIWTPEESKEVCFLLEINIGFEGSTGTDLYQVMVATPEGLKEKKKSDNIIPGRHYIIILEYDWETIESYITKLVESCSSETEEETNNKLCRFFHWEYEDHEYVE